MTMASRLAFGLSVGRLAELACLLEVAAPKPGNVHRSADFEDATLEDFLASAVALGQIIDECKNEPLGTTILHGVQRTKDMTGTNTNLGMILLFVPLAKTAEEFVWADDGHELLAGMLPSIRLQLANLTVEDTEQVFRAIRIANPSGLGTVGEYDVSENTDGEPDPPDLLTVMQAAADRDLIAKQYANGFEQVFQDGVELLLAGKRHFSTTSQAIVYAHVALMARYPDSLIGRKCGIETAEHSQMLAKKAIKCLAKDQASSVPAEQIEAFWGAVGELDFWLRSDGHRRNPGTTADLIAASLFVLLVSKQLEPV